jgi:nicotinamide mononucleotide transporter
MSFFSIGEVAFEVLGYAVSYIELVGTLFGLISVYLASRLNVLTWVTGIANEFFLFLLFFQVQLYPDMLLQLYFFATTLYGWYLWGRKSDPLVITAVSPRNRIVLTFVLIAGTVASGFLFASIHLLLPDFFPAPSAYPFGDSFVLVSSIIATVLLAKKKLDSWLLWIAIDAVCVVIYLNKGIYFLSLEYLIFLGLAFYGWLNWNKQRAHA